MSAFDKIIGYELIKEELKQIADCLKHTDKYRKMGVSIPRGLLLEGRPGVGKTLMATCLVEESGRRAFICRKDTSDGSFKVCRRGSAQQLRRGICYCAVLYRQNQGQGCIRDCNR